jgi:hypothetical protein
MLPLANAADVAMTTTTVACFEPYQIPHTSEAKNSRVKRYSLNTAHYAVDWEKFQTETLPPRD